MTPPTEEEWNGWLMHPCTEWMKAVAAQRRQEIKDHWEAGGIIGDLNNALAIGSCKALQIFEDLTYEQAVLTNLEEVGK